MNTKKLWPMLALTALLAACGGGNEGTASTESSKLSSPPPAPVADAELAQLSTNTVVTPGETFRIVLGKTSCIVDEKSGICTKQVPLGEVGIKTSLKLTDVKFFFGGNQMDGVPIKEEGEYRFFPIGYYTVWKPDIALEVMVTLAPSTASGTTATVVLQGTSGSFDKKLNVVPAPDSKVTVFAQANYAPAQITVDGNGFQYSCLATVSTGCWSQFTTLVHGAPNVEVRLYKDDLWIFQGWTDENGYLSLAPDTGLVYPGQWTKFRAEILGSDQHMFWFRDFMSTSGGKQIAPVRPSGCTPVTPEACKG